MSTNHLVAATNFVPVLADAKGTRVLVGPDDSVLSAISEIGTQTFNFADDAITVDFEALVSATRDLLNDAGFASYFASDESDDEGSGVITYGAISAVISKHSVFDFAAKESRRSLSGVYGSITPATTLASSDWPEEHISPGMVVVLGDTGSGKTHFLRHKLDVDIVIRQGEPKEDIDRLDHVYMASNPFEAIVLAASFSMLGFRVGIDSLRTLLYGLSGAAMSGGISSSVFTVCTNINNFFANCGVTVVAVINPMLDDVTKGARLFERLSASVVGAIHIVDRVVEASTYRLETGRVVGTGGSASAPEHDGGSDIALNIISTPVPQVRDTAVLDDVMDMDDSNHRDDDRRSEGPAYQLPTFDV